MGGNLGYELNFEGGRGSAPVYLLLKPGQQAYPPEVMEELCSLLGIEAVEIEGEKNPFLVKVPVEAEERVRGMVGKFARNVVV